ncbi:MAG TPA: hypothetical protein VK590_07350 [Saprospiraceae bacterium]|nr:hypothetical protein [Saprospiraceae bacterium]
MVIRLFLYLISICLIFIYCKKDSNIVTPPINPIQYKIICPTTIKKDCSYIEGTWFEINNNRYPLILPNSQWQFSKTYLTAPWGKSNIEISFDCSKIIYKDLSGIYQGEAKILGLNDSLLVLEDLDYKANKIVLMRVGIPAQVGPIGGFINQDHLKRFLDFYCSNTCNNSNCLYSFSYLLPNTDAAILCNCSDGSTGLNCNNKYKRIESKEKNSPLAETRTSTFETYILTSGNNINDDKFEILKLSKDGSLISENNFTCQNCQDSIHDIFINSDNSISLLQGAYLNKISISNNSVIKQKLQFTPDAWPANITEGFQSNLIYCSSNKICIINRSLGNLINSMSTPWVGSPWEQKTLIFSPGLNKLLILKGKKAYLFDETLSLLQTMDFDVNFSDITFNNGFIIYKTLTKSTDNINRIMYPYLFEIYDVTLNLINKFYIPSNISPWVSSCIYESNQLKCLAQGYTSDLSSDKTNLKSDIFKFIKWNSSKDIDIFNDYIIPTEFGGVDNTSKFYSNGLKKYACIGTADLAKLFYFNIDENYVKYVVNCQ